MEDKKKGGYSAASKTPRPRRPRVSGNSHGPHAGQPERIYDSNSPQRYSSEERPRRSYGDRPQRSYGEDRPQRSYGEDRPARRFSPKGGPRKPFRKDFRDDHDGIDRMIRRRPQVSDYQGDNAAPVEGTFQEEVRLNKFIANSGVCSRREADQMIQAGVVTVNGEVVTELGTKINVLHDEVRYDGQLLQGEEKVYIVMNKPRGYVTTASDPHADKTGVLMLTNDGEMAERLTHPSYDKKKIYQVILDRPVSQEDYDKILSGITLGDGPIKADELEYIDQNDHAKMGIEIHSGKNRIVRRIFESLGYDVRALDRVYFAGLTKKGLKKGEWRYLSEGEANVLKMGAYL